METAPEQPRKQSGGLRIFMIICAVIVLLGGAASVWKGVQKLRTRNTPEFTQKVSDSDNAIQEGSRLAGEAMPLFQQLLKDVDSLGLNAFRSEKKEAATKANDLYGQSVEQFRLGEKKLEEAKPLNRKEELRPYLEIKAKSYGLRAEALAGNQEIIRLILDESIPSLDVLLPKLSEAAARRDEMGKKAQAAHEEATELGNRLQGKK